MDIFVKVIPGARQEKVKHTVGGHYRVHVKTPPEKGKANERLVELLAEYFGISRRQVVIRSGKTSRLKRVVVSGVEKDLI